MCLPPYAPAPESSTAIVLMAPFFSRSEPPSPGSWTQYVLLGTGAVALGLGLLVLAGWHFRLDGLLRLHPSQGPMVYNTALCFLAAGLSLLSFRFGRVSLAATLALLPAGLSLLVLGQEVVGFDVDQWGMADHIGFHTAYPGRMALPTVLAFVLYGMLLAGLARRGQRMVPVAVGGAVLVVVGLATATGYLTGLTPAPAAPPRMTVQAAFGFMALGSGLFAGAWQRRNGTGGPPWLWIPAGIGSVALSLFLWQVLRAADREDHERLLQTSAANLALEISERIEPRMQLLAHMARRWEQGAVSPLERLNADAAMILAGDASFRSLILFDTLALTRRVYPGDHGPWVQDLLGATPALQARLRAAALDGTPPVALTLDQPDDGRALLVGTPLFDGDRFAGYLLGVLPMEALLAPILARQQGLGYGLTVSEDAAPIYQAPGQRPETPVLRQAAVELPGTTWHVNVWPTRPPASPLPHWVLGLGLTLSGGLMWLIFVSQKSSRRSVALAASNRALNAEIDGRRRSEHRLAQSREALRHSESRYRLLVDQAPEAIVATDPGGCFVDVNPSACAMLGYTEDELLALRIEDTLRTVENRPVEVPYALLHQGRTIIRERLAVRKDGTTFPVEITARRLPDDRLQAIVHDITARKAAEDQIRRLNQALRDRATELERANRDLEAFNASVSHDLRAPLRHMTGFVKLLQERCQLDEEGQRYAAHIAEAAGRMNTLIEALLHFSRTGRTALKPRPVSLARLVAEAREDVQAPAGVVWEVGPLPEVLADPALLRLVLVNLLSNAVKFSAGRTPPRIEVGCTYREDECVIFVRDNGVGFDMAAADRLFGVFQRLHNREAFEGTGIGLANVRRIIERHGGRVWAEGAVDAGATFYFSLPYRA